MNNISEKLQQAMEEKDISYGALSDITGIPKSALHRYINGDTEKVPIDRIKLIANALGISAAYVMGWETEKPTTVFDDGLSDVKRSVIEKIKVMDDSLVESLDRIADSILAARGK